MNEVWKDIKGFEGKYMISNLGRVKSFAICCNGKIMKPKVDKDGYLEVSLALGKRGCAISKRVHRLVAEAFLPNPNDLPIINHINGIRSDNRVENLEWCDNSYNQWHRCHINNNPPNNEYKKVKIKALNIKDNNFLIFNSIKECANFYSVTESAIQRRLKGKISNPTINSKKSNLNFIKFEYFNQK